MSRGGQTGGPAQHGMGAKSMARIILCRHGPILISGRAMPAHRLRRWPETRHEIT
jgi:hypothetical protein